MNFSLRISWRYLKFRKSQLFLSLITAISIVGVAVGVMALIITLSVMNGFQADLRDKILGVNAHIIVLHQNAKGIENYPQIAKLLEEDKHVLATAPFVYGQAILKKDSNVTGVLVKGIIPASEIKVSSLEKYMKSGNLNNLVTSTKKSKTQYTPGGIVLGSQLARELNAEIGSEILLVSPQSITTSIGIIPLIQRFKVVGIFDSGMYEYDHNLCLISLVAAQNIYNQKNKVTGLEVKTGDFYKANKIAGILQDRLGYPYWVRSWAMVNRNLFSALKLEKMAMFVILTLIVLVAAFNIVGTLMMITIQKTRCIGIMRALGTTKKGIMRIFICEGLIIGIMGTLIGMMCGFMGNILLDKYKFIKLPSDIYYLDHLPVKMQIQDIFSIGLAAILISFLATIYPSWKASRLNPIEAIRYE